MIVAVHHVFSSLPMTVGMLLAWLAGHGRRPPEGNRIAVLSSEIPSLSATFVFREINALEEGGWQVYPFALRQMQNEGISSDGLSLIPRTTVLYGRTSRSLRDAARHLLCDPVATVHALGMALRDCLVGRDLRLSQRIRIPYQALVGLALAWHLRRTRVRHLHIHFIHAPSNVGMYAAIAARLPFSITAHANDLYVERSLILEKGQRAAFLSTISEFNRTELKRLGVAEPKLRHLPCGVDTQWFDSSLRSPDGDGRLLTIARLVDKKGIDLLIRAIAALHDRGRHVRVRIVGDGPRRAKLEELARGEGVSSQVQFLGPLGRNRIRRELCAADMFVLPCRQDANGDRDGIPVVLMEAMAMGVPVLSTRISGVPELVIHAEGGLLVNPEDVMALTDALEYLLSNPMEAKVLGLEGRKRVLKRHDQRVLAERLGQWISQLGQFPEETRRITGISARLPRPMELRP